MVVPTKFWTGNIKDIQFNHHKYTLLNTEHLSQAEVEEEFHLAVNVVNMLSTLSYANEFLEKMGSKKSFKMDILFDVQKAIFKDEPMCYDKAEEYFKLMKEFEGFVKDTQKISPFISEVFIDSDTEMMLLGLTLEEQNKIEDKKRDNLSTPFFDAKYDYLEGRISFKAFYGKAKEILDEYKENRLGRAS